MAAGVRTEDDSTVLSPLSAEDIDRLLTLLENKIPVQDEDWDELTHQFNQGTNGLVRTVAHLQKSSSVLAKSRSRLGTPTAPRM